MKLILRELTAADETAFMVAYESYAGEDPDWFTFVWKPGMGFAEHLERLRKNKLGLDLPDGRVTSSILYSFVESVIVGRVSIRHELNEYLSTRGGHIGYSVAPRFRRRGFAAEMFRQTLVYCRGIGLPRLLVTCDDGNIGSRKILENAGAVLEGRVKDEDDGTLFRRYWIDT